MSLALQKRTIAQQEKQMETLTQWVDTVLKLASQEKVTEPDLDDYSKNIIIGEIYIGKSWVEGEGQDFDHDNSGIYGRWKDHTKKEKHYRMVVLCAFTLDDVHEDSEMDHEDLALAMESRMIQHYLLFHPDKRYKAVNKTWDSGGPPKTKKFSASPRSTKTSDFSKKFSTTTFSFHPDKRYKAVNKTSPASPRSSASPQPSAIPRFSASPRSSASPQPSAIPRFSASPQPSAIPRFSASPRSSVSPPPDSPQSSDTKSRTLHHAYVVYFTFAYHNQTRRNIFPPHKETTN